MSRTIKDIVEEICKDNTHLLDEPEIKEIIEVLSNREEVINSSVRKYVSYYTAVRDHLKTTPISFSEWKERQGIL